MEEWLEMRLDEILKGGGKCLVALDDAMVAGFNLISYDQIHIPVVQYTAPLGPDEAFSEQITVSVAYRGHGLGSKLRYKLYKDLFEGERYIIYGATDVNNKANLALCRKVGLDVIATIKYRKWLWIEKTTRVPSE